MTTLPWAGIVFMIVMWAFPFGVKVTDIAWSRVLVIVAVAVTRDSEGGGGKEFGELHEGNLFLCFLLGEYEIVGDGFDYWWLLMIMKKTVGGRRFVDIQAQLDQEADIRIGTKLINFSILKPLSF